MTMDVVYGHSDRTDAVRAVGATRVVDRTREDIAAVVLESTSGRGAAAVFDPIGAATYDTSIGLLAPRGCLLNYGQLAGALPPVELNLAPRANAAALGGRRRALSTRRGG
jgi:NADPH:quinone reductase-like Zn-dependent oxidoreductase